jgi:hypothetical protein
MNQPRYRGETAVRKGENWKAGKPRLDGFARLDAAAPARRLPEKPTRSSSDSFPRGTHTSMPSTPLRRGTVAAVLLGLLVHAAPASGQEAAQPAEVLVLGLYHFANPGLDIVQTEVADVLSAAKQEEIARVVEALLRFRPTRVAVEHLPGTAPQLDSLFSAFLAGTHTLQRDETQQIGFRVARALGLDRVHPIDHRGEFPFGAVMAYAQENDPAFVAEVQAQLGRIAAEANRQQRENTVGEILRNANDPAQLADDHAAYLRFARVGAGDTQVGAELLARWYERNIRIFSNLQTVARPGDRVLVLIGSGHAPILRELIRFDHGMRLVEPAEYLPDR